MKEYLSLLPPPWVPVAEFSETLLQLFFRGQGSSWRLETTFEAIHSSGIFN